MHGPLPPQVPPVPADAAMGVVEVHDPAVNWRETELMALLISLLLSVCHLNTVAITISNLYKQSDLLGIMEETLREFNPWWRGRGPPYSIDRRRYSDLLEAQLGERDIVLITGIRRVGKTVMMQQMISRLLDEVPADRILYVSLDHPLFLERSLLDILREFRRIHGLTRDEKVFLFFDEVQRKEGFEQDLKVIYDMEDAKVFASGSSSLLLKEKGAFLTGRYATVHVMPLDFREYLAFRGVDVEGSEGYLLETALEEYLRKGGMPEYVLRDRGPEYITSLLEGVMNKDIVGKHGVRHTDVLRKLLLLLSERVGKPMTYSKLGRVLGVTNDTVRQFVGYFEETFLVSSIMRHARSLNERVRSPKKIYMVDTGIRTALSGFRDKGSLAENLVFNQLIGRGGEVRYYHDGDREIDFVVDDMAVEVKYKDTVDEMDYGPLLASRFKKKVLITKGHVKVKGLRTVRLVDLMMGEQA